MVLAIQETWGKNVSTDYSIRGYSKPDIVARNGNMNAGGGGGIWVTEGTDLIWSEWRLTVIAATVRIALVDILDPVSYTHLTLPTIYSV